MSVQEVFDATASSYDEGRRKLIPPYDRFYAAALELIPSSADRLLELGAGTGLYTAMLRKHLPQAKLHLLDISAAMLAHARTRLGEDARVTMEVADYGRAELPVGQDVVTSALSIHHLEDEAKQSLFAAILRCLRPGGVFVNADQIAGPNVSMEATYVQRWLAAVRACGATEQQIADSLYRQEQDRRSPLSLQLFWLQQAGFEDVDCWFKDGSFAVITGSKPRAANQESL